MQYENLTGRKVGICVSGGLDSKTVTHVLRSAGVEVLCFTADLAQPDEDDIAGVVEKMQPTGARTLVVDLKTEMAEGCFEVLKYQARYDGGYWNTTGIGRAVMVNGLLKAMQANGCDVLSHGATGRGNDQLRFERYTNVLAPQMSVYAPWRDPGLLQKFPGRKQMLEYLHEQGIEAGGSNNPKRYSTDANLAGLSHEAEDLESLETACQIVDPIMGVWPELAPDAVESVEFTFSAGRCTAINSEAGTPLSIMEKANTIGGRNGIWMRNALENRVIGTKSRGVYEAPGMEIIGFALTCLYQAILDRRSSDLFQMLSKHIGDQLYDGRYYDPSTRAAKVAIESLTERADGIVTLGLYKGNQYFQALRECPGSLYFPEHASMEASDGLNPASSQGYVEVQSVEARSLAAAGHIRPPTY